MYPHIVELYCFPHALLLDVMRPTAASTHYSGQLIEKAIKKGEAPALEQFLNCVRGMPLGEQNYLTACYLAWISEEQYARVIASGKMPYELYLAKYVGGDAQCHHKGSSYSPLDGELRYNTYCYSPRDWRRHSLELRIAAHRQDILNLQAEFERLAAPPAAASRQAAASM